MKYEHMSWAAHLYPLTSIASPLHSTSHPLPSTPHHPHQALETIFVEEAFGDFNEKHDEKNDPSLVMNQMSQHESVGPN